MIALYIFWASLFYLIQQDFVKIDVTMYPSLELLETKESNLWIFENHSNLKIPLFLEDLANRWKEKKKKATNSNEAIDAYSWIFGLQVKLLKLKNSSSNRYRSSIKNLTTTLEKKKRRRPQIRVVEMR